jgi:hypothetical protein
MSARAGRPSALSTLTEAVTLVLTAAGLVYVLGGVVLALRLWFAGLPVQGAVAQLPEELVITVGLSEVIAPALLVGLIAVVILLVSPRPLKKNSLSRGQHKARVFWLTLGTTIAVLLPGTLRAAASYKPSLKWLLYLGAVLTAAVATVAARMIVNDILRTDGLEDEQKPELGEAYLRPGPLLKIGATTAALGAIASLIFVGGREMVPVAVCLNDGSRNGHLIGQSGSTVYLALGVDYRKSEQVRENDEAVLAVGDDQVTRILYGAGVAEGTRHCPS